MLVAIGLVLFALTSAQDFGSSPLGRVSPETLSGSLRLSIQSGSERTVPDRSGFWYQAGRKLTIGTLAGLNSEVLFTNQKPGEGLGNALLLYAPTMIVMDEIVQRYHLDGMSTFFLGSIYGLFIEGIIAATIQE